MPVRPRSTQCSPPHAHALDRLAPGAHALGRRARQAGADQLDHLIDGEAMASIVAFRAASGAAAGEQLERAAAVCLLKTSSAAEILVITDPNANRNKIEI